MLIPNRGIVAVSGEDRVTLLQGLVTNDVSAIGDGQAVYSCLLTAQGRFLHDFFVVGDGKRLLLDCEADRCEDLLARLKRFRLRSQVEIADETERYAIFYHPRESANPRLTNAVMFADPRCEALGHRIVAAAALDSRLRGDDEEWKVYDRLRIALGVPDGSRDMVPEQALLLENNIDRLHGISWTKGCYVGQELTARMHYKGGVKRLLTPVRLDEPAPQPGTPVTLHGEEVGEMRSSCGDVGLALLRVGADVDRLHCGSTRIGSLTANDSS